MYTLNDLDYRIASGLTPKAAFKNMKASDNPLKSGRYYVINTRQPIRRDQLEEFLEVMSTPRVRARTMYCIIFEGNECMFFTCNEPDHSTMDADFIFRHAANVLKGLPVSGNTVKILMEIAGNLRRIGYANHKDYRYSDDREDGE